MNNPYQLMRVDTQDGVPVVMLLTSELRSDTMIARLEQELEDYVQKSGVKELVLDMSAVHFLTSNGLRLLIVLRRKLRELGGRYTMCGVHPHVASVFKTTRLFTEKFDFLDDVPMAIAALKAPPPEGQPPAR
jgi:anti-anti-sigma factor